MAQLVLREHKDQRALLGPTVLQVETEYTEEMVLREILVLLEYKDQRVLQDIQDQMASRAPEAMMV